MIIKGGWGFVVGEEEEIICVVGVFVVDVVCDCGGGFDIE